MRSAALSGERASPQVFQKTIRKGASCNGMQRQGEDNAEKESRSREYQAGV